MAEAIDCAIEAAACWKRARLSRDPEPWENIAIAAEQDATELPDAYAGALDPETIEAVLKAVVIDPLPLAASPGAFSWAVP